MEWREPTSHPSDCYFCSCNVTGHNKNSKKRIIYPNIESVSYPIYKNDFIRQNVKEIEEGEECTDEYFSENRDSDEDGTNSDDESASKFNQEELNDLVRDLGLSKESSELLASRLKEKKSLTRGTSITFYRERDSSFRKYFCKESYLTYCTDVEGLVNEFSSIPYKDTDRRLFIDSSIRSLKTVLLHNGNIYTSLSVAHSVTLKEEYNNLDFVLTKLNYNAHKWEICGDLKILTILLGQQSGFTKFPCFLCEWDSRNRQDHWTRKEWPARSEMQVGSKNVIKQHLIDPKSVLLPPLHIKLELVKQMVKAMRNENRVVFNYLFSKFPKLSEAKIKEGVFDCPQIRLLMRDKEFEEAMTPIEKAAWTSFREVVNKFLGNNKDRNYKQIVETMLVNFEKLGCLMNLKIHFLHSHIDYFPENLGNFSEEQGERFHQDIKDMERRYQGVWDEHMMADYCWNLKRDCKIQHKRKAKIL
ncbi:hypothetical protein ALC62_08512 [Cyphomyrmex costatus]|uniref:Uncharacterized protein n=1 Tax=Cyphomyrmex costatus TaxID=456900 RepID=A0A151K2C4_9HYME|nr:hypothetical protein ALC62_08512 [Cyphomyrmex costatus]